MVATTQHFSSAIYQTHHPRYSGVVKVQAGDQYGTGTLLYDGRAILTAAHLWSETLNPDQVSVHFETSSGSSSTIPASAYALHPDYSRYQSFQHDVALIWLDTHAPIDAWRYDLYRDDALGAHFQIVGYGRPGTGQDGYLNTPRPQEAIRLNAWNTFDADASLLGERIELLTGLKPEPQTQWVADFDNGMSQHDALGLLAHQPHLGLGSREGMITPGDSGGPAFVNGQIAGIASYTARLEHTALGPDIDHLLNGSFGELGFWQNTAAYQQWIDQEVRAAYTDAPSQREDVVTHFTALAPETQTISYFLLEFLGERHQPDAWISLSYTTQDGTAQAGVNYIPTAGNLVLYPEENHAVIPVTLIGHQFSEAERYFSLNMEYITPQGEVIELSAQRTLIADESWLI